MELVCSIPRDIQKGHVYYIETHFSDLISIGGIN